MSRYKTFDATGIAPGGRLFAGDENAIQDRMADAANFGQTIDLGTLRIGDTALNLLKYGTGDVRLTAAFRTDGILRGLGGIYFGSYTTTDRDLIALGSRPFGLHIFNTTTGQLEWNSGSDAVPSWQGVSSPMGSQVPIGAVLDWPYNEGDVPGNYAVPYGQAVSRTTYATLNAKASAAGYPHGAGNGTTTFNLPDYRGRYGVGKDDMGGSAANRVTAGGSGITGNALGAVGGAETVTLSTGQLPAHNHAITGSPTLSGAPAVGTLALPNHVHSGDTARPFIYDDAANGTGHTYNGSGQATPTSEALNTGNPTTSPAISGAPAIGSLAVAAGSLATSNTGTGTAVNNMGPVLVVNKIMRVL